MEVHHHSNTARKKWAHYFWEFLMLFLAVFCGFLAEYQLEHKIEKDRAKELAKSFYDELKSDSVSIQMAVQSRLRKDSAIMYLADFFQDSSLNNLPRAFGINYMLALMVQSPTIFEPRSAILDQLKNSGSLRYFKSKELQILTGDISVAIVNLKNRQEIEQVFFNSHLGPFNIRHGDHQWIKKLRGNGQATLAKDLESYTNSTQDFHYQLGNFDKINKAETINMLQLYLLIIQTTRVNQYIKYISE